LVGAPSLVDFGPVSVGAASDRTISVKNVGDQECPMTRSIVGDPSFAFAELNELVMIAPGAEAQFAVRFSASFPGDHMATLHILRTDAPGFDRPVILRGHGVGAIDAGLPAVCVPTVMPDRIDFGDVRMLTSANQSFIFSNAGTGSCDISMGFLPLADPGFSLLTRSISRLEPGQSAGGLVTFVPQRLGEALAQIFVSDPSAQDPQVVVSIRGNGVSEQPPDGGL
jgi:hypothetical protein